MKRHSTAIDIQALRLAISYLGVMVLVSIVFSATFYITSSSALHVATFQHQLPKSAQIQNGTGLQPLTPPHSSQTLQDQTALIKQQLVARLISLNAGVLIIGGAMSYYLARRTLRPMQYAMDLQQQFFSDASHELKTPLSALHLRGEVALRNQKLTLTEAKETISSNVEQVVKLEHLSRDLLQLAKAGYDSGRLSHINLAAAVTEAVEQVQEMANAKTIHVINATTDTNVYSDTQRLARVFAIVLDNAIKYSPPNTSVSITAKKGKRTVAVSIRDEGPGIPATDLPHIFERFYQGDRSRKREGFGLGLSIAATTMHQLEGSIQANSSSKGTTMTIHIPTV